MQHSPVKACYTTNRRCCSYPLPTIAISFCLLVVAKQHNEKIRLDRISQNGKTTCIGGLGGLEDFDVDIACSALRRTDNKQLI
jgi:hypothetical protein